MTSLWFVPGLFVLGALVLAGSVPALDRALPEGWSGGLPLVFSGRASGARAVLGTIATSMIGVAGVVFSMTIVSLQLAASQFGPRLLRTFLRDRGTQVALGTFLGTFLYCIVVLPTVEVSDESVFIPHTAVTIAVALAIVSLAMLVYYIDHIAQSIHADAVIVAVARDLESVIDELFPENLGDSVSPQAGEPEHDERTSGEPFELCSNRAGFVRFVDGDRLIRVASSDDLYVRVRLTPGDFALRDACLAEVWTTGAVGERAADELRSAFVLGPHRTTLQDVAFAFEQLAEIAVRSLSSGINDPTTAVHCVDQIGSGLARLVSRKIPSRWRSDESGILRAEIEPTPLSTILEGTVIAISRCAGVHLPVWLHLVSALEEAESRAGRSPDRALLRACAARLRAHGSEALSCPDDGATLEEASQWAIEEA